MHSISQAITNAVFPPSDPALLARALVVLHNATQLESAAGQTPSVDPGFPGLLTVALQVAVDQNDVPCMMLLFSQERATHLLSTEKGGSAKHKKGLKCLSRLRDVPDPIFSELFNALVKSCSHHDAAQAVNAFVADLQHALDSHTQRTKLNNTIQSTAALNTHKKL